MASLTDNLQSYILGLTDTIPYTTSSCSFKRNNFNPCIENHNMFSRFLVFDCSEGDEFTVPTLFSNYVTSLYKDGIDRFIKPIYVSSNTSVVHRGPTTIMRDLYRKDQIENGCRKCVTAKNEVYYILGNILFDKDFNILMMPCYDIIKVEDSLFIKNLTFRISNKVFGASEGAATMSNFIIKKLIPYLGEERRFTQYYTGSIPAFAQPLPIKVEIEDLSRFVCQPSKPSETFEAEINTMLKVLADDIVKSNM